MDRLRGMRNRWVWAEVAGCVHLSVCDCISVCVCVCLSVCMLEASKKGLKIDRGACAWIACASAPTFERASLSAFDDLCVLPL